MRLLGQRLLIGLAVAAAAVMGIGYALIAGGIAAPIATDLGTFDTPTEPGARAVLLEDGRPAFIVATRGRIVVLDARARHDPGAPGRLVTWCAPTGDGLFLDPVDGSTYAVDGELLGGPADDGLVVYPVREVEDGARIVVGADGRSAGVTPGDPIPLDCPADQWVRHEAPPAEVFDPSVAAGEEPPGWIWLEGALDVVGGEVRLCDGLDGQCATSAPVRGIDPALVPAGGSRLIGSFIGRVLDDAIQDLSFVPDPRTVARGHAGPDADGGRVAPRPRLG